METTMELTVKPMSLLEVVKELDVVTEKIMQGVNAYCNIILGPNNTACGTHIDPNKPCKQSEKEMYVYEYMKRAYGNISQAKDWFENLIKEAGLVIVPDASELYDNTICPITADPDDMQNFGKLSSALYTTIMDCVSLFRVVQVAIYNDGSTDIAHDDTKEPCILDCLGKCFNIAYSLNDSMREYFCDYIEGTGVKAQ